MVPENRIQGWFLTFSLYWQLGSTCTCKAETEYTLNFALITYSWFKRISKHPYLSQLQDTPKFHKCSYQKVVAQAKGASQPVQARASERAGQAGGSAESDL